MNIPNNNRLLSSLSLPNRNLLLASSAHVHLPIRTSLYEAEIRPSHVYFMTSGMASIVTSMQDGGTAEVGVIGNEGVVGSIFLLGGAKVSTSGFIQLAGSAYEVPFEHASKVFRSSEEVRDRVLEFVQEQTVTGSQIAGCNRLHEAEERLARWLLMAQDRTQSDVLDLTHEFMAMMVGAQRTTVTLVAGALQRANLIEHSRGRVKILSRENLKMAACDCYNITKTLYDNLYQQSLPNLNGQFGH